MGIHSNCFPIWKRRSKERLHFHMGMCLSPFPYGNHHMETGSRVIGLPIWKRGFTLSIWGCVYPRFHMAIAMWNRGAVSLCSIYGNGDSHIEMGWKWESPFLYGDPHFHVVIRHRHFCRRFCHRFFPFAVATTANAVAVAVAFTVTGAPLPSLSPSPVRRRRRHCRCRRCHRRRRRRCEHEPEHAGKLASYGQNGGRSINNHGVPL